MSIIKACVIFWCIASASFQPDVIRNNLAPATCLTHTNCTHIEILDAIFLNQNYCYKGITSGFGWYFSHLRVMIDPQYQFESCFVREGTVPVGSLSKDTFKTIYSLYPYSLKPVFKSPPCSLIHPGYSGIFFLSCLELDLWKKGSLLPATWLALFVCLRSAREQGVN